MECPNGSRKEAEKEMNEEKKKELEVATGSYILIKHKDSGFKASWKDPNGEIIKQRTEEGAKAILEELRSKINSGTATFSDLAREHSDCSSAKVGGDLGTFVRYGGEQAGKEFEDALFGLKVGDTSEVTINRSGAFIVQRTS